jgi:anti-sigma factor RsiW
MSGKILPFDAATHKVVDVLLPWFVNGTLDNDERALVEKHLAQCERCRGEVDWLRDLHAACAGASPAAPRLRSRLMQPRTRPALPWSRAVIAAQLAAILVLGAIVAGDQSQAPYRTLGAADSTARASASLVVVFDPAATELDMRRVLRQAGARIVDGPTQANAYLLDVPAASRDDARRALKADRRVLLVEPLAAEKAR